MRRNPESGPTNPEACFRFPKRKQYIRIEWHERKQKILPHENVLRHTNT